MYNTEQITDNSYENIQTLYRLSFRSINSISSIKAKYDTSGFGLKNIGILARDENNIPAAYYGVFPITLSYDSNSYLIAQSGDTMTAPDHQKKGLFTKLAKETYSLSEKKGIKMIFGFPNENSYPGFKHKLDWIFNGHMQLFTIKVLTIPICELSSKLHILKPIYTKFVKSRLAKFVVNLDEVKFKLFSHSNVKGFIKKDENFFNYKLSRDNVFLVKLNGFTMLIKTETHLYIGDIYKIEKNQTKELIETVKKLARRLGCKKAIFSLSKNHWLFDYLTEYIKSSDSLPIGFYLIDKTLNANEIQFTYADYDTF